MTKNNEQIIIDGEKLTKAGFINKFSFKLTNADLFERERICSKFFDIIQRKEQECERLENENKRLVGELANNVFDSFDELDQLKAEKEEIKKYLGISSKTILERLEELQEFRDRDRSELFDLQQTLAEIKEMCKLPFPPNLSAQSCYDSYDACRGHILDKISEVLDV